MSLLFEDSTLLAINKPAGLRSIVDGYDASLPSVRALLSNRYGPVWIIHRLDKDTSGVLLLARNTEAHRQMSIQFENRQVHKIYHAVVRGIPPWRGMTSREALRVNGDRKHRTIIDPVHGRAAKTDFAVLEQFEDCAWIEARPRTGYTHQIRAHLSALGYPILSDDLYGIRGTSLTGPDERISRLALHAVSIEFSHPQTGRVISIEAPYPADFANLLMALKQ